MMALGEMLDGIADVGAAGKLQISDITADSRRVQNGSAFIACQGTARHGIEFVDEAVANGAAAVIWEPTAAVREAEVAAAVTQIAVPNLGARVGELADRFFGAPSAAISITGITGTNGKTTTAWLASDALNRGDGVAAYMGTLGYGVVPALRPSALTTPGVIAVHRRLAELAAAGVSNLVMEVSSHGLDQGRVDGVRISTAAFTNLTRDHLDYHGDFAAYQAAKAKLFALPSVQTAVINIGDAFGAELAGSLPAHVRAITVALSDPAGDECEPDVRAECATASGGGLQIELSGRFGSARLHSELWGRFNAENLLVAVGILLAQDFTLEQAVAALTGGTPPPGRMQVLRAGAGQPAVIIDFAHTPDALEQALATVREHCGGRIICVFGCGGERDTGKRGEMGAVAARLADHLIVTSDNPRGEDPQTIINAIMAGIPPGASVETEADRAVAIGHAIGQARGGDAVLVAGKGSEDYQLIAGRSTRFSDAEVAAAALGAGA